MKLDSISEKVLLTSIAAGVALAGPLSVEASKKTYVIDDITFEKDEEFSYGQKGFKISSIQHKLLDYNFEAAIEENGVFGVKTHSAIRQFQKMKKLKVDGIAGPATLSALFINEDIDEVEVEDHVLVKVTEGKLFRLGDRGDSIKEIQKLLIETGYYFDEKDGIFGPLTEKAVINYQKNHGLMIDGIVGQETYKHLSGVSVSVTNEIEESDSNSDAQIYAAETNIEDIPDPVIATSIDSVEKNDINTVDLLQNGDRGQAVKDLQKLLKNKGYYNSSLDGIFGPRTEAAVRNYQINNQLAVDGIAGPQTIHHLKNVPSQPMTSRSNTPAQRNQQETNSSSSANTSTNTTQSSTENIISTAKSLIGTRYLWGGTTPNGFDCSGFLMYVYKQNGKNLPRTVAEMWNHGTSVSSLQRGDFVFFETYKRGPSHAGIYLGNNQFIHTGTSSGTTISDMRNSYWSQRYLGAKRMN